MKRLVFILLCGCGASQQGIPQSADFVTYSDKQIKCVLDYDSGTAINICRVGVKASFCLKFPELDTCKNWDGGTP